MGAKRLVISLIFFGLLLILVSCKSTEKTKAYLGNVLFLQEGLWNYPEKEILLFYNNKTFESVRYYEVFERITKLETGSWTISNDTIFLIKSRYSQEYVITKSGLRPILYVLDSLGNRDGYMRGGEHIKVPSETTKKVVQLIKSN